MNHCTAAEPFAAGLSHGSTGWPIAILTGLDGERSISVAAICVALLILCNCHFCLQVLHLMQPCCLYSKPFQQQLCGHR